MPLGNIAAFLSGEGDYEYGYLIDAAARREPFSASALLRVFTKKAGRGGDLSPFRIRSG